MKEKELFIKSLETLLYSWGGDTPAEVYWGLNEFLDWFEKEYNIKLNIKFYEDKYNSEEVIDAIMEAIGMKKRDYINKDEIQNLVEYCLNDIIPNLENKKIEDLVMRLDIEFRKAKEYYREMYKKEEKKCKTN